jgi:predicted MFS family arabinose efflux permease
MDRNSSLSRQWTVVIASTIALVVGNGPVLLFTFSVFLKPIAEQMDWSRGTMSLGVAIALTFAGLMTPLMGRFIDRWGVQRVLLFSITVFALSVAAISLAPANVVGFVALYALSGLLSSGQAPLPYAKAITSRFDAHRGLALGIAMAGVGIGTSLMPQVASFLIRTFDWREAYIVLGSLTWLIAFPAAFFVNDLRAGETAIARSTIAGDDVVPALRSRAFWSMAVAILLVVVALNGAIAHLLALLTDRGMASSTATSLLIGVGLATILGRLISGFLLDRVFAPHLAAGIFLIPLIGMTTLLFGGASLIAGLATAICFGFSLGAEVDIVGYLVSRYFGLRHYGEIYGYIFAIFTIGSGVGPYLMGLSFDMTHSYTAALGAFCGMLIVASATIWHLGPYRFPAKATGKWSCGEGENVRPRNAQPVQSRSPGLSGDFPISRLP